MATEARRRPRSRRRNEIDSWPQGFPPGLAPSRPRSLAVKAGRRAACACMPVPHNAVPCSDGTDHTSSAAATGINPPSFHRQLA